VQVRWRVKDPALFYTALSHSEFYERKEGETRALPIYEAIIQQCTTWAVTHAYAIHGWEDILITNRGEVENHCKRMLQEKLDTIHSGIDVVNLTIKDLHPPYWRADRNDPTAPLIAGDRVQRGPASAFEFVVSTRQFWNMQVSLAQAQKNASIAIAKGDAAATLADAEAYRQNRIAQAQGEAGRMLAMFDSIPVAEREFQLKLLEQQLMYKSMQDVLNPANGAGPAKIIVDPGTDFTVWQVPENNGIQAPSGRGPGQ